MQIENYRIGKKNKTFLCKLIRSHGKSFYFSYTPPTLGGAYQSHDTLAHIFLVWVNCAMEIIAATVNTGGKKLLQSRAHIQTLGDGRSFIFDWSFPLSAQIGHRYLVY